jgi:hypothetical protein
MDQRRVMGDVLQRIGTKQLTDTCPLLVFAILRFGEKGSEEKKSNAQYLMI